MLAHRLGLVPLKGNKEGLKWLRWFKKGTEDNPISDTPSDYNTVVMNLEVECTWKEKGMERYKNGETDPEKLYNNSSGTDINSPLAPTSAELVSPKAVMVTH